MEECSLYFSFYQNDINIISSYFLFKKITLGWICFSLIAEREKWIVTPSTPSPPRTQNQESNFDPSVELSGF